MAGNRGCLCDPLPKQSDILGELTIDQIAAIASEIATVVRTGRQEVSILLVCRQQWSIGQQPIFVSIPQKQLSQGQQIGIFLISRRSRDARTVPIERRLGNSVDKSKRLMAAHVTVGMV